MVRTQDGFEIAEVDLEIRGPGDIMGTQQSGDLNLKLADLAKDGALVGVAREAARSILSQDEHLNRPENRPIQHKLMKILKSRPNWGKISWINIRTAVFIEILGFEKAEQGIFILFYQDQVIFLLSQ